MKKLAIIIPGIGYTKDRPLLYYSSRTLKEMGYELIHIDFSDMPQGVFEDDSKKLEAVKIAMTQMSEQLSGVDFGSIDDVVFLGKSLGTVAAAKYVSENGISARQIWYTPVEKTFSFDSENVLAFIGDADPWSNIVNVRKKAEDLGVKLFVYEGLNHSLEKEDVLHNIRILNETILKIREFVDGNI